MIMMPALHWRSDRPSFRLPSLSRATRLISTQLNFITLHYAYFLAICMVSSLVFWGSSTPARSVSFTDSLFLCVSAMTEAGLNTINLSQLNTFQQIILFLLILLGSTVFVSAFVIDVRRRAFQDRLTEFADQHPRPGRLRRSFSFSSRTDRLRTNLPRTDRPDETPPTAHVVSDQDTATVGPAPIPVLKLPDEEVGAPTGLDHGADANRLKPRVDGDSVFDPRVSHLHVDCMKLTSNDSALTTHSPNRQPISDEISPSRISFDPSTRFRPNVRGDAMSHKSTTRRRSIVSLQGVGAVPGARLYATMSQTSIAATLDHASVHTTTEKYFPSQGGYIARNSSFHNLSETERKRLGGVEYRALQWLSWIVPAYFVLWQFLGCLGVAAYVARNRPDSARDNGLNPWWVGAFMAVSAFNNSGMSLLDANMTAYQTAYYMIITMSLLILAGNTCYPIFLRLIIWTIHRYLPSSERWDEHRTTLKFLLDHPRRCYTNLFPSQHTWWLLAAVVTLNGIDWAAFEILNIGNKLLKLPRRVSVIDGLFQAFAVRSGGFYIVSIPNLRISLQVLYVVMMYISVYPVVITMRNSNVYEERSLGIYADDLITDDLGVTISGPYDGVDGSSGKPSIWSKLVDAKRQVTRSNKSYFVRQQVRAQLAHDIWWIVVAIFLIMIIEGGQFERNPTVFSVFNVIFEVVSGYGTVGMSVGVPNADYSFCGAWHALSKLVLCGVMLRGRHRGLPVAIDKAVILPCEGASLAEEEDGAIRIERSLARRKSEIDLA